MWDSILSGIKDVNDVLNSYVWGWPTIIMILGTGLLLTIRTRVLQVRKFGDSLNTTIVPTIKSVGKKRQADRVNSISQFEAFSTAISGTVGTGNIVGVVAAILTGGPGAVLWMWISAFFGMVTNYSENVLGLYFRKNGSGLRILLPCSAFLRLSEWAAFRQTKSRARWLKPSLAQPIPRATQSLSR